MQQHLQLKGKVVFLTGGSRGIGAALVRRLAKDGASVAFTYVSNESAASALADELNRQGQTVLAIKADSRSPEELAAATLATKERFGAIDIVIANAGVARFNSIEQQTIADYDYTFDVNVRGTMATIFAVLPYLPNRGRIITIGSVNADRMPVMGGALYAASKAALKGLVKGLARDLAPRAITVNNVQPGPFDTDMNPDGGAFANNIKEHMVALKRFGKTDELGGLISYLASEESSYITGTSIDIDGGLGA